MFDLDASKIVIVGVAALIFIPPKDLPRVMRQVGQFVGKIKRMANEFQGQFMDAMREADMADLRKEAQKLSDAARIDVGLNSIHDIDRHMQPLPGKPEMPAAAVPALNDLPPLALGTLARNSGDPVTPAASHAPEAPPTAPSAPAEPAPVHSA